MGKFNKIQGERRFEIFRQLQRDKTLIKMHLPAKDYDHLTIITGIRAKKKNSFFFIDYPEGFKEAVADVDPWKIHFEFTGKDNVPHTFRTSGGEISEGKIWIRFPELIERKQKRKNFRIATSPDTKIHFRFDSIKIEMNVINLSIGGTLVGAEKEIQTKPILKNGENLKDIELVFTFQGKDPRINIKKASVVRVEKEPLTNLYHYAIRFTDIEENEEKALTELIYEFQRHFLRNRLPIDE